MAIVMDKVDPEVCETETYNTQGVGSGDPRGSSLGPGEECMQMGRGLYIKIQCNPFNSTQSCPI